MKLSDNYNDSTQFDKVYVYGIFIKRGWLIFCVEKYEKKLNGIYVWVFVKIWKYYSYPPFWYKNNHRNQSYSRSYPHYPLKTETFVVEKMKKRKNKMYIKSIKIAECY